MKKDMALIIIMICFASGAVGLCLSRHVTAYITPNIGTHAEYNGGSIETGVIVSFEVKEVFPNGTYQLLVNYAGEEFCEVYSPTSWNYSQNTLPWFITPNKADMKYTVNGTEQTIWYQADRDRYGTTVTVGYTETFPRRPITQGIWWDERGLLHWLGFTSPGLETLIRLQSDNFPSSTIVFDGEVFALTTTLVFSTISIASFILSTILLSDKQRQKPKKRKETEEKKNG